MLAIIHVERGCDGYGRLQRRSLPVGASFLHYGTPLNCLTSSPKCGVPWGSYRSLLKPAFVYLLAKSGLFSYWVSLHALARFLHRILTETNKRPFLLKRRVRPIFKSARMMRAIFLYGEWVMSEEYFLRHHAGKAISSYAEVHRRGRLSRKSVREWKTAPEYSTLQRVH